nr:Biomphalaria glabrata cytochrome b5 reductase 4-like; transcript variant X4 [Biomphalaria glabrata]
MNQETNVKSCSVIIPKSQQVVFARCVCRLQILGSPNSIPNAILSSSSLVFLKMPSCLPAVASSSRCHPDFQQSRLPQDAILSSSSLVFLKMTSCLPAVSSSSR